MDNPSFQPTIDSSSFLTFTLGLFNRFEPINAYFLLWQAWCKYSMTYPFQKLARADSKDKCLSIFTSISAFPTSEQIKKM